MGRIPYPETSSSGPPDCRGVQLSLQLEPKRDLSPSANHPWMVGSAASHPWRNFGPKFEKFTGNLRNAATNCKLVVWSGSSASFRPSFVVALCLSSRRCNVSRPGDSLKRRFSWFPNWIPKEQTCANLVDHAAK